LAYRIKSFIAIGLAIVCFALQAEKTGTNWVEGTHYFKIIPPLNASESPSEIKIFEFFWYGCGHCFDFEPALGAWKKNINPEIRFDQIPAVFDRKWAPHARAFYTAKKLKILDNFHAELFNALHVRKEKIYTEKQISAFFIKHGVEEDVFDEVYHSFEIDVSVRKAMSLTRASGISGVPSMIVNGQYRTSVRNTGSFENLLNVVDYLATKK
jgi:thiol:disulfide interchange protein DsbA